ncbi:conserved hypothetical protein [Perkinsus marinus ATCC 50983]|uniref:Uncharacterized protein n=1 Tax=Perkinsus marinus (strain ATCC 50983 / TXsc) TaxID=423536 RepID=C5KMQ6_PERM5|nr:conserved hypothetical protein [Perkinsus marinus ATCC 50983]EER14214.1 conserved hypothetical protein [Perkinsus marinus ATCC 50983]|eukprot:XP_002782419.1 conserved hypothetical protein [Perkinsus marinus ATCC 50983]
MAAFWETGYNRPGKKRIFEKNFGLFFIYFGFLCPTLMTIFGSNPRLLLWFMDEYRPLEYPPRSDPTIINEIMNDRIPESSSIEAYEKEGLDALYSKALRSKKQQQQEQQLINYHEDMEE